MSEYTGTLADGTAVTVNVADWPVPMTVWTEPGSGDAVTVTYKAGASAPAQSWPAGPVTGYADDIVLGPIYSVTFQRTSGSGSASKYGVRA